MGLTGRIWWGAPARDGHLRLIGAEVCTAAALNFVTWVVWHAVGAGPLVWMLGQGVFLRASLVCPADGLPVVDLHFSATYWFYSMGLPEGMPSMCSATELQPGCALPFYHHRLL